MNFIDELKEYLNSKTKEEILKDWEESSIECDVPFTLTNQLINKTESISGVIEPFSYMQQVAWNNRGIYFVAEDNGEEKVLICNHRSVQDDDYNDWWVERNKLNAL